MIRFTLEVRDEILEMHYAHPEYTPGEIAEKIGCTEFQVVRTIHPNY